MKGRGKEANGPARNKRACVECTEKCSRIHGSSDFNSDQSSFFKVMLGDDFNQALFIPPSFGKSIEGLVNTDAFLEDSMGSRWKIRVCKKQKTLAFGTGWCKFIEDHSVSLGEFLVFKQTEKSVFSVQIYSTSGYERVQFCKKKEKLKSKEKSEENPNKRKRETNPKERENRIEKEKSKENPSKMKRETNPKEKESPKKKRERTIKRKEKEEENPTKMKKEGTLNPKRRKALATRHKRDPIYTPTIQEMTRREEQKERRTRSTSRKLIMKELENKDLLVNEEISIIAPICAVPSDGNLCLALKDCAETEANVKNCEETMSIICVSNEPEKIEENSGNEKGKNVEGEQIFLNEKGKNVIGKMNIEQVGSLCENITFQNLASEGDNLLVKKTEVNQESTTLAPPSK